MAKDVSGNVKENNITPVETTVRLYNKDSYNLVDSTTTDVNGDYIFLAVDAGNYFIVVFPNSYSESYRSQIINNLIIV